MFFRFQNRAEAGLLLANKLRQYEKQANVVILALPRGGVPVASPIADRLRVPLDVFLVRKIGAPGHEEYALGAIASGGVSFINENAVHALHVSQNVLQNIIERESLELARRERTYRGNRQPLSVTGKIAILVDDGLATGASMKAAVMAVRKLNPSKIVVAVPVAAQEVYREFTKEVEEVVCLETPDPFFAVGEWYEEFGQISDNEVQALLDRAKRNDTEFMKTLEIRNTAWKEFCEEFTRWNKGSLITIEMLDSNGERTEVARDIPFDRMVLDQNNPCSDVIVVSALEPGKRGVDHLIVEPIHVMIRETSGHTKVLQILAENGTTSITFSSGKMPETLTRADWTVSRVELAAAEK